MEFDKGDVIVKIGESEKWYIYSVEDGFYFIGSLDNLDELAEVKIQKEVDKDYVKVDEMEEDEVDIKVIKLSCREKATFFRSCHESA